jgi:hypothetical protein
MIKRDFISRSAVEKVMAGMNLSDWDKHYVMLTLEHENYQATIDGEEGFKIDFKPPFVGLGQFKRRTWDSLVRLGLLDYPYSAAGNPAADISAILALAKDSEYAFKRAFPNKEFTHEIAYGYHNQGAPAFEAFLKGANLAKPGQSDAALAMFARVRENFHV